MFEYPSLIRLMFMQVTPIMLRPISVLQNAIGTRDPIIIAGQLHVIGVLNTLGIQKCQWIPFHRLERAPNTNDLPAFTGLDVLSKLWSAPPKQRRTSLSVKVGVGSSGG
jgi:hypothetical protein